MEVRTLLTPLFSGYRMIPQQHQITFTVHRFAYFSCLRCRSLVCLCVLFEICGPLKYISSSKNLILQSRWLTVSLSSFFDSFGPRRQHGPAVPEKLQRAHSVHIQRRPRPRGQPGSRPRSVPLSGPGPRPGPVPRPGAGPASRAVPKSRSGADSKGPCLHIWQDIGA